jgi:hypothetical protein
MKTFDINLTEYLKKYLIELNRLKELNISYLSELSRKEKCSVGKR